MSRYLKIAVACAAMLALALPAFAIESKINGYLRVQGISGEQYSAAVGGTSAMAKDVTAKNFVDQRLRVKWTANVNDDAGFVYYGEFDTPWGKGSGGDGTRGTGGAVGADAVNMETKNAYLFFKAGDFKVNAGVQTVASGCDYTFILQDVGALTASGKVGGLATTLIWAQFMEDANNKAAGTYQGNTDLSVYGAKITPMLGSAKLDLGLFWIDNNRNDADQYTFAAEYNGKVAGMALKAWLQYQFGDNVATGASHTAYAMSAKLSTAAGAARFIMYSKDDDATDSKAWQNQSDYYEMPDTGLMIFMTDKYHNNGGQGAYALYDAAYTGYGLVGLTFTGKQDMGDIYVNYAAGYFQALSDSTQGNALFDREGKDLGLEIAAGVGTKMSEKVDVSLRGSYALLGSFYDAAPGGTDPDDAYKVVAMLNMGF